MLCCVWVLFLFVTLGESQYDFELSASPTDCDNLQHIQYDYECLTGVVSYMGYQSFYLITGLSTVSIHQNKECDSSEVGDVYDYTMDVCTKRGINIDGVHYKSVNATSSRTLFYLGGGCSGFPVPFSSSILFNLYNSFSVGEAMSIGNNTISLFSDVSCRTLVRSATVELGCAPASLSIDKDVYHFLSISTHKIPLMTTNYIPQGDANCPL